MQIDVIFMSVVEKTFPPHKITQTRNKKANSHRAKEYIYNVIMRMLNWKELKKQLEDQNGK